MANYNSNILRIFNWFNIIIFHFLPIGYNLALKREERSAEEAGEGLVFGGLEFGEAELDGLGGFAFFESSGEAVPKGENGGIVGVGFVEDLGVMHTVHIRGHN